MENNKALSTEVKNKIDEISTSLDLGATARTVLKITPCDDPRKKTLTLLSGDWNGDKPWFIVDEKGEVHALSTAESLMGFIRSMQFASNENFGLKLEKAIWKYFPIDFHDVWTVATEELKRLLHKDEDAKILEVDIEALIETIYKKHPNLFYHIKEAIEAPENEYLE